MQSPSAHWMGQSLPMDAAEALTWNKAEPYVPHRFGPDLGETALSVTAAPTPTSAGRPLSAYTVGISPCHSSVSAWLPSASNSEILRSIFLSSAYFRYLFTPYAAHEATARHAIYVTADFCPCVR